MFFRVQKRRLKKIFKVVRAKKESKVFSCSDAGRVSASLEIGRFRLNMRKDLLSFRQWKNENLDSLFH